MAIRDVLKMGDPRLLEPARPIEDFASIELAQLIVDMHDVQYIDSAALGILLLMRDRANSAQCAVELHNLRGVAKEVLEIANFQKIFTIR